MKITEFVSEDWQKTNRKDRTSGMSRKAVKAYRRENPGSNLQTAVTTKPSKLKKGSKSAKRRKSFCARMRGMKKSRTSAKTARNPNSNINKALRRWNCESIEQMQELVMIAEQKIAALKQGMAEGFDELDAYIKDKQAVKPRGGAGIKRGSYGTGERKTSYSGKTVGLTPYGTGSAIPSNRDFGKPHSIPRAAPRGIDDFDANHRKVDELGVAEATGDPKFDKMLKGITSKRQVAKQQRADTKQQARDAFGGMFGGGNPADKLSIRKKGVAEGFERFQVGDKISFPLSQMATGIVDKIDDKRLYVKLDNGEVYTIPSSMLHSVKLLERQGVEEGTDTKFVVTYYNNLSDDTRTVLVSADDEYDAKDKINYALGRGSIITDVRPAKGNEPTDQVYKVYGDPRSKVGSPGIYDRGQGVAEGSEDIVTVIDGVRSDRTYNDRYHAHNSLSKLVGYGKAKIAELYINGEKVEHFELGKKYIDFEPKQLDAMSEAGPFSYGVKKPRKGSVADLAAKKRKEQERGMQPVEPRDHMVGIARVKK